MKKYDLYIFFLGLITGIFLTVIIAICYNNYYNQESSDITFFEKPKDFIPRKKQRFFKFWMTVQLWLNAMTLVAVIMEQFS